MIVADRFYRAKYGAVAQQLGLPELDAPGERGFVVVQIDALAHTYLRQALERGYAPAMKRLLDEGFLLAPYLCGLPSSTPACQSAIMYGTSYNVPAFRWYDKEQGRTVSCKAPYNAFHLERYVSQGRRGVLEGGSSYSNLVSGGAARSLFTMSTMGHGSLLDGIRGFGFFVLFALSPVRTARVIVLSGLELGYSIVERAASYWKDEHRVRFEGWFPFIRVFAHVFVKEMQTFLTMVDMYRGVPNIYVTYNLYDNLAHHFGPTSGPAFRAVRTADRQIRQIDRMRRHAALRYDLIVLSDHGQTPAIPFRQIEGRTFGQWVAELVRDRSLAEHLENETTARSHLDFLGEELRAAGQSLPPAAARLVERARSYVQRADLRYEPQHGEHARTGVVAVGCSGMAGLYFNFTQGRATLGEIEWRYPGLVRRLAEHPCIGLVIARDGDAVTAMGRHGAVVWDGVEHVVGKDPLAELEPGRWPLHEIVRLASYPRSADLIVFGSVVDGVGAAFEEQMGVHGALGGPQAHPFVLYPPSAPLQPERLLSSADLYDFLIDYLPKRNDPPSQSEQADAVDAAADTLTHTHST